MENTWTTPTVTTVSVVGQLDWLGGGGHPGWTPGGGSPSNG